MQETYRYVQRYVQDTFEIRVRNVQIRTDKRTGYVQETYRYVQRYVQDTRGIDTETYRYVRRYIQDTCRIRTDMMRTYLDTYRYVHEYLYVSVRICSLHVRICTYLSVRIVRI